MREKFDTLEYSWNGYLKKFYVWFEDNLMVELFWNLDKDEKLWIKFHDFTFNSAFISSINSLMYKLEQEAGGIKSLAKVVTGMEEKNDNNS